MKGFKKLLLTSAILAASSSAMAMQAMDDESLSATTGQDGITITTSSVINDLQITYIDRDGFGPASTDAGGIVIGSTSNGIDISTSAVITVDVGTHATAGSTLNINIASGETIVDLGGVEIHGGAAGPTGSTVTSAITPAPAIVSFGAGSQLVIAAGGNTNIQLGAEVQGSFIRAVSDISSISLTNVAINDLGNDGLFGNGGSIGIGRIIINDLHSVAAIDVTAGGLRINTAGSTIGEVGIEQVTLGATPSIGDIYLAGLDIASTITVAGH